MTSIGDINREIKQLMKRHVSGENVMHQMLKLVRQREELLKTRKFRHE